MWKEARCRSFPCPLLCPPRLSCCLHSPSDPGTHPWSDRGPWQSQKANHCPFSLFFPLDGPVSLTRQFDSLWDLLVPCPGVGLTCSWSCSFELSRPLFATTTLWDTKIGLCRGPGGVGLSSAPPGWSASERECPSATMAGRSHLGPLRNIPLQLLLGPSFCPHFWAFPLGELEQNSKGRLWRLID